MIVERMTRFGRGSDVRHLSYEQAGHGLIPYPPRFSETTPMPFDPGGSAESALSAHTDAWPQVVAHLARRDDHVKEI